jgi:hypothetical protein
MRHVMTREVEVAIGEPCIVGEWVWVWVSGPWVGRSPDAWHLCTAGLVHSHKVLEGSSVHTRATDRCGRAHLKAEPQRVDEQHVAADVEHVAQQHDPHRRHQDAARLDHAHTDTHDTRTSVHARHKPAAQCFTGFRLADGDVGCDGAMACHM